MAVLPLFDIGLDRTRHRNSSSIVGQPPLRALPAVKRTSTELLRLLHHRSTDNLNIVIAVGKQVAFSGHNANLTITTRRSDGPCADQVGAITGRSDLGHEDPRRSVRPKISNRSAALTSRGWLRVEQEDRGASCGVRGCGRPQSPRWR